MDDDARRRRRRVLVWTAVTAVVIGVLSWAVGVSVIQSVLLATVVTTVGAVVLALDSLDDETGLPPLDDQGRNEGTRREVSRLSWVMAGQDNRVGDVPYRRLRAIAANRLRLRGVDVTAPDDDAAARDLLGAQGYALLVAETNRTPTQREFQYCLTLLEQLDETPDRPDRTLDDQLRSHHP